MNTLIIGADRNQLRLILQKSDQLVEDIVELPSKERNEKILINQFLSHNNLDWHTVDKIGVIILPDSKTSVRVMQVIAQVVGWYKDIPIEKLATRSLMKSTATQLLKRLQNT